MIVQANKIDSRVDKIDLEKIKFKLLNGDEQNKWTEDKCRIAETEYKRFLTLLLLFPKQKIIPNKLMDAYWHQHILDTKKYARDCENVFGYFLHHNPYYGLTSAQEFELFQNNFLKTQELYEQTFGEPMFNLNYGLCENDGSNCVSTGGND